MAYTFMDDYGTEWAITTPNPYYKHHRLISFVEIDENHEIVDGTCRLVLEGEKDTYTCRNEMGVGVVWSDIILKSDAATDASVFWQWEVLDMEMENKLIAMLENAVTADEKSKVYDDWYELRDEVFLKFYQEHPEHPDAKGWIEDYKECKEEANA